MFMSMLHVHVNAAFYVNAAFHVNAAFNVNATFHVNAAIHVNAAFYVYVHEHIWNAGMSGIRSVRYRIEKKTKDAGTGPVPD
jgi:hypothetical protein